jgi:LysM repeat protein
MQFQQSGRKAMPHFLARLIHAVCIVLPTVLGASRYVDVSLPSLPISEIRHPAGSDNTGKLAVSCGVDSSINGNDYWGVDTAGYAGDSIPPGTDSAESAEMNEEVFQENLQTLFGNPFSAIDTAAWDSSRIHGGEFDVAAWQDTVRIVLSDSSKGKRFVPPCCNTITSEFGQRRSRWHYGIDIKVQKGDSIRSAFDGIIRVIQYDRRGYGHVVVIRHAGGLETLYGHLSQKLVVPRQCVKAGDVIGLGGNTGRSTGPHLHFEIRFRGGAINPRDGIDFSRCRLLNDTLVISKVNFAYLIELRKAKWHTILKGNTLGSIARRHHTSIAKLCSLNHLTRKSVLRVGRKIRYQ